MLDKKQVAKRDIVATTFTKKGAKEIQTRIGLQLVGVRTMDSLCNKMIREVLATNGGGRGAASQEHDGPRQSSLIANTNDTEMRVKTVIARGVVGCSPPPKVVGTIPPTST